jgi:hypothetical protein
MLASKSRPTILSRAILFIFGLILSISLLFPAGLYGDFHARANAKINAENGNNDLPDTVWGVAIKNYWSFILNYSLGISGLVMIGLSIFYPLKNADANQSLKGRM